MEGLDWQTLQIPFGFGQKQDADSRALSPADLAVALDVEFDDQGGLTTRHPFAALGLNILGGGTIANPRRLVANGAELLLFTKDALYSWSSQLSVWVLKGTHLACKVEERTAFGATGDQIDGDRAELSGVVVFTWTQGGLVYVGAEDKTTGAVLVAPTAITAGAGVGTRPRLVTLSTKILLLWHSGTDAAPAHLQALALDPAAVATSITAAATTVLASPNFGSFYDVARIGSTDTAVFACRRVTTTSYTVGTITAALVVTTSTKALACSGPIAVAPIPGTRAFILRSIAGGVGADYIDTTGLVDITMGTAIGTFSGTLNQLTGAVRSVAVGGVYRCYAFWSYNEADNATDWRSSFNWIDQNLATGTEAALVRRLGIASRAFDYDGRVYVWTAFASASSFTGANVAGFRAQLQNTYFLYRENTTPDDGGLLVAKAVAARGGGFCPSTGRLPHVSLTSGTTEFTWCATERRIIPLGVNQSGYAARAPREVTITFDSNEARRCVRLGQTLYVTGGEILQYDGASLTEVGFHIYPWWFGLTETNGAGSVADGTFAYKVTMRADNARGEIDRSTTATVGQVTLTGGPPQGVSVSIVPLYVTRKRTPAVEIWRTAVNPTPDAPFYLASGKDPAVTSTNGYRANDPTVSTLTAFADQYADASLTVLETHPENGAVLENLAPPAATIIAASADRVFLAGVAGDPNLIWYSKLRGDGEVAAFNDALTVPVPPSGGAITALAFLNETLIAFCERAIYALPGQGFDNLGGGSNYGPARIISADVGATSADAVAVEPRGVVFHSSKGKHLLTRGFAVEYIGGGVCDYDAEAVLAVQVLESKHQIRWLTASRMLVLDYKATTQTSPMGQWSEWTIADGLHATLWNGAYVYLATTGAKTERADYTGVTYGMDVETAWIKLADLQGAGRVRRLLALGEYRGTTRLRVRIARDYNTTWFDDKRWPEDTENPDTLITVGAPLQVKVGPTKQRCQAFKIRITAITLTGATVTTPTTEAIKLTGLGLEVGINRGLHRRIPTDRRA